MKTLVVLLTFIVISSIGFATLSGVMHAVSMWVLIGASTIAIGVLVTGVAD